MPERPTTEGLTEALHRAFHDYWAPGKSLDLYADSPLWQVQAAAVEHLFADYLAEVRAEAEVVGQMKHITAEMVRGDQPPEAKEEMIADLRARLSHVEAERDDLRATVRRVADTLDRDYPDFTTAHAVTTLRAALPDAEEPA